MFFCFACLSLCFRSSSCLQSSRQNFRSSNLSKKSFGYGLNHRRSVHSHWAVDLVFKSNSFYVWGGWGWRRGHSKSDLVIYIFSFLFSRITDVPGCLSRVGWVFLGIALGVALLYKEVFILIDFQMKRWKSDDYFYLQWWGESRFHQPPRLLVKWDRACTGLHKHITKSLLAVK